MRAIVTSIRGLSLPGIRVEGVESLPAGERAWVADTTRRLLATPTSAERIAATMLGRLGGVRQAYFKIRGRSYFLDIFLPTQMVAVEIDGSSHKARKDRDRRRDADFRSVGIRTIRVKNKDVLGGRLFDKLFKRLNANRR